MPFKNKQEYNNYMKSFMKDKRKKIKHNKLNYSKVMKELTNRSILPIHIYHFRQVLKQMLKDHFKRRCIPIRNKTEIITQSYIGYL